MFTCAGNAIVSVIRTVLVDKFSEIVLLIHKGYFYFSAYLKKNTVGKNVHFKTHNKVV